MKQEIESIGAPDGSRVGIATGRVFAILFTIAGLGSNDGRTVADRLGLTDRECRLAVDDLQRQYLVDAVSMLDGDEVRESLVLTDEGERILLHSMEKMCELPEQLPT